MILKKDNLPLILYHGTNRKFTNHSLEKSRTELNDRFQGDWICYTASEDVAWKYANAARNQCINREAFLKETEDYLNRSFPDKLLNSFLVDSFKTLMDSGFDDAWDVVAKKYSKIFDVDESDSMPHFFKRLRYYEELDSAFDFNDFCDVLEHVEYSKFGQPDESDIVMNMFNNTINEIPEYVIEFLQSKGYKESLPEPKIIRSYIEAENILETDSREKAKEARKNGYDLVIYSGPDCVDGEPEYLIADASQIKMQSMKIAHKEIEYINESKAEWYENVTYSEKSLVGDTSKENRRKMRF
jgi:hypothetical protein